MEYITPDCTVISPQIDPSGTVLSDTKKTDYKTVYFVAHTCIFL